MRPHWERTTRVPRPPVWAAVLVGFWLLLVLGGVLLEKQGAPALDSCLFHRLTGQPCPTCGSTRVVLGLGRGAWSTAFRVNPLVTIGLLAGGLWLGVRLATGRALQLDLSRRERFVVTLLGIGGLLANWAWVLLHTQG